MGLMCLFIAYLLQCQSSLCLHPERGLLLSCFYIASLWLQQLLWVGCRRVVFAPSFLWVWSQRPWWSQQIILLSLGFLHTHLQEFDRVKIWDVDLFLRKSFWFSLNIFRILDSIWLRSRALYILAAMDVKVIPWQFLAYPRSPFLGKRRMHPFAHLFMVFWLYTALKCRSSMSSNCLVFHASGGYFIKPCCFSIFNFS